MIYPGRGQRRQEDDHRGLQVGGGSESRRRTHQALRHRPSQQERRAGGGHGAGQGGTRPDQPEGNPPQRAGQHDFVLRSDQMLPVLIKHLMCDQIG